MEVQQDKGEEGPASLSSPGGQGSCLEWSQELVLLGKADTVLTLRVGPINGEIQVSWLALPVILLFESWHACEHACISRMTVTVLDILGHRPPPQHHCIQHQR